MSAICGIFSPTTPINTDDNRLSAMMQILKPYGLDGQGAWQSAEIALGQQATRISARLAEETHPAQIGHTIITADARLDNRDELCGRLGVPETECAHTSNSHLILLACQQWGLECPQQLLGDFAFAIWDAEKQHLFCVRDSFGVRPFYYARWNDHFFFASDIESLLAIPGFPVEFDETYLAAYFHHGASFPHAERTLFKYIQKLPPAHAMLVSSGQHKTWQYWQPEQVSEVRFRDEKEYPERLTELFAQAVSRRVQSSYPVGAHISGGLDSSAIAVVAARLLQQNGKNLAGGFCWSPPISSDEPQLANDERKRVLDIAQKEGFPLFFADVSRQDAAAFLMQQRPISFVEFSHEVNIRRQANASEIRTLLSGWGGDEVVTSKGIGFFPGEICAGRWKTAVHELNQQARLHHVNPLKLGFDKFIMPFLPGNLSILLKNRRTSYQTLAPFFGKMPIPLVLELDLRARLQQAEKLPAPDFQSPRRRGVRTFQHAMLQNGHIADRLEGWAALGARSGIQYVYPLLDRQLVEFSLGLPPGMYVKSGWSRWIFRQAMRDILPPETCWEKDKADPAVAVSREKISILLQQKFVPLVYKITKEWLDAGGSFYHLDPAQVRQSLEAGTSHPMFNAYRLMPALTIEKLANPLLAEKILDEIHTSKLE